MTTVCGSCAGFTTAAISPRRAAISPLGSPDGSAKYSKLTGWVEESIEETLTFYRLPRQHHKHLKSTNMLERLDEEIKRPHPCRAHLPQWGELFEARARPRDRDP